jgi:hypothetical protein
LRSHDAAVSHGGRADDPPQRGDRCITLFPGELDGDGSRAGFTDIRLFGDFARTPFSGDSEAAVCLARKAVSGFLRGRAFRFALAAVLLAGGGVVGGADRRRREPAPAPLPSRSAPVPPIRSRSGTGLTQQGLYDLVKAGGAEKEMRFPTAPG